MAGGRPTEYDPSMLPKLEAAARKGASHAGMAAAIGIAKSTFYDWRSKNEEFSDTIKYCDTLAQARLEELAMDVVMQRGNRQTPTKTNYLFNLLTRRRQYSDEYGPEKQQIEHSGRVDGDTKVVILKRQSPNGDTTIA